MDLILALKRMVPERVRMAIKVFRKPEIMEKKATDFFPYVHDGLATRHRFDFLTEPRFQKAFLKAEPFLLGPKMYWRTYVVCWAASKGASLDGDFVECGVYKGGFAQAVVSYTNFDSLKKNYYLFDTYKGLAREYSSEKEREREQRFHRYEEDYYEETRQNFREHPNVVLVRGTVPETLNNVTISKVAFLSLDMNSAKPEESALRFFWPKLSSGAVVVFDDYGFHGYEEQKVAHDRFASELSVEILLLPTGQGLLIKP